MKDGTCRIFLVPKVDERGQPLRFREQRLFAVEMDKFLVHRKYSLTHFSFIYGHIWGSPLIWFGSIDTEQWILVRTISDDDLMNRALRFPMRDLFDALEANINQKMPSNYHNFNSVAADGPSTCFCRKEQLPAPNTIFLLWSVIMNMIVLNQLLIGKLLDFRFYPETFNEPGFFSFFFLNS